MKHALAFCATTGILNFIPCLFLLMNKKLYYPYRKMSLPNETYKNI